MLFRSRLNAACIRLEPPTRPARSQSAPSGSSAEGGDGWPPAAFTQLGTPGLPLATAGASLHLASATRMLRHLTKRMAPDSLSGSAPSPIGDAFDLRTDALASKPDPQPIGHFLAQIRTLSR